MKKIAIRAGVVSVIATFYVNSGGAFLPIEHWQQPSGAQVWLVHSPSIPMVDVQLQFDGGSRRDPVGQEGLANATALMMGKGIQAAQGQKPLDENALGQAWADLGASLEASAGNDSFSFSLRSLTQPALLAQVTALASRQIAQPLWDGKVWQRERQRWTAGLAEADTRPAPWPAKPLPRRCMAATLMAALPRRRRWPRLTSRPCKPSTAKPCSLAAPR